MNEKRPQTLANHTRFDPPFHFFLIPVFVVAVGWSAWNLAHEPFSWGNAFQVILMLAALVGAFKIRLYALHVQDRVIRLEERLRFATLLPEPLRLRVGELNEAQLVALRFASDAELPQLVEKTLAGGLSRKQIKQAIVNWRPDYFRV
jgi:hypothetical protein